MPRLAGYLAEEKTTANTTTTRMNQKPASSRFGARRGMPVVMGAGTYNEMSGGKGECFARRELKFSAGGESAEWRDSLLIMLCLREKSVGTSPVLVIRLIVITTKVKGRREEALRRPAQRRRALAARS